MRTSTLSTLATLTMLGVLPCLAQAEPPGRVAGTRTVHTGASLTTGALAITGASRASELRRVPGVAASRDSAAPRRARKQAHLSASDVAALVAPHEDAIERCYLTAVGNVRRTSQLDVMFVIARQGNLLSVDIGAPDASPYAVHAMTSCIRTAVADLQFPERRNDTTAIIPYVFQRTEAPDAGPQLSCWNPRGC
jgi:hypothetical protein